jgi:hypothetical protein
MGGQRDSTRGISVIVVCRPSSFMRVRADHHRLRTEPCDECYWDETAETYLHSAAAARVLTVAAGI